MALQHFLAMGGFAAYIWSAYAIVAVVLIGNLILPLVRHKKLIQQAARKSYTVKPQHQFTLTSQAPSHVMDHEIGQANEANDAPST